MEIKNAVGLLSVLAQETRLKIFKLLVEAGQNGLAAGDIRERMQLPASTLSFHLKDMTHAGLLLMQPQGRYIIYSANYLAMNDLVNFLTENCCQGQPCQLIQERVCNDK